MKLKKIVITSGYFNPLHVGHVNLMRDAKAMGDFLAVIVNNDEQVKIKGSIEFMPQQERVEIIKALRPVDEVFLSIDQDASIANSLSSLAQKYLAENGRDAVELYFAKGGDRNASNIPEAETMVCRQFNITIINGVGGGKVQSSSWLLSNKDRIRPAI